MAHEPKEKKAQPVSGLADGVLVQVCVECGQQYFFEETQPPPDLKCERCGNMVFRSFFEVTSGDEVEADFRDVTQRDVTPQDPATDVARGDLYDLNNP